MKKLIIIIAILLPVFSFLAGQTTIDRAMAPWARDRVNANFTEVYADVDTLESTGNTYHMQSFANESETIALTEDVWAVITNGSTDLWTVVGNGFTAAGDSVTIVTAGDYSADISVSLHATASDSIQIAIFKNAVRALAPAEVLCIGTETLNLSTPGLLLNLVAGDDISVRIVNLASSDDAVVTNASLVLHMLKPD